MKPLVSNGEVLPDPIPILVRLTNDDLRRVETGPWRTDFALHMRVIEHGFEDVAVSGWIDSFTMAQSMEREDGGYYRHLKTRMVKTLVEQVGRRHGIWIFHIMPMPLGMMGASDMDRFLRGHPLLPDVADRVRDMAHAIARLSPHILLHEGYLDHTPYDALRMHLRDGDLAAMQAEINRAAPTYQGRRL